MSFSPAAKIIFQNNEMVISSLYIIHFSVSMDVKSFTIVLKDNGPSIDPYGTPVLTSTEMAVIYPTTSRSMTRHGFTWFHMALCCR